MTLRKVLTGINVNSIKGTGLFNKETFARCLWRYISNGEILRTFHPFSKQSNKHRLENAVFKQAFEELLCFADFPSLDHLQPSATSDVQTEAVRQLITRVVKDRASRFVVKVDPSIGPRNKDTFRVSRDTICKQSPL